MKFNNLTKLGLTLLFILMLTTSITSTEAHRNKNPHYEDCIPDETDPPADDTGDDRTLPTDIPDDPIPDGTIDGRTLPTDIPDDPIPDDTGDDDTSDDDKCPGKKKGWFKHKNKNWKKGHTKSKRHM